MSQENVDRAYALYDAVSRRDLDGMLAATHDDVVPDYRVDVEAVRDLGDATLARITLRGHGASSGAPIDQRLAQVVVWRDGKIVRLESFHSEAEALAALSR